MSTKVETSAMPQTLLYSPLMTFYTLLAAVVIGSSLLEFNELLFPPKITSVSFWALFPVYVVALDGWFGVIAWSRNIPYTDRPLLRTMMMVLVIMWIVVLALMYFASRTHISLLSYLWGLVVLFTVSHFMRAMRIRITERHEPGRIHVMCNILSLVVALVYSVWFFAYPPIPNVMNWVFVAIAFVILVGWRVFLKTTHIWRPEEKRSKGNS